MTNVEAVVDEDWEYRRVQLPPGVSRVSATVQLSIQAEYSGWELSNVRLYSDGTRKVWLRRRRTLAAAGVPGMII
ncbi:hypothetical protein BAY61_15315 [Prauserella marina]|uniref:Uncharacterized protein n=1 Tax=Prauserella marina TaxID=530584 RepID=A0A222VQE7_9PSEU|nr:DUF5703 family protein [Prauserella marina]ASR36145.1 hypothetical protein BAY61_15315 [Prauserella marina]PWV76891.1 hypothetical protein DES30_105108 [Prauserella marina]SDC99829.1 hypothetical protein SAMN05421630_105109 [Prauserella marina]